MATSQGARTSASISQNLGLPRLSTSELLSDVLLRIFIILRDAHSSSRKHQRDSRDNQWDWIAVSKVCRRWRLIALESSILWTKIRSFCSPEKIRTFLERSGQAELDIDMMIPSFDSIGIPALFEGHMWRVRAFKFAANMKVMESIVPRLGELTQHAKTLGLAYVFDKHEGIQNSHVLRDLPNIIPNVQLDRISLGSLTLPWSSHLYNNLSEISFTSTSMKYIYIPTIWQFIDALERSPNLRHFKLDNFTPSFNDASIHEIENRKVRLAHLRSIVLTNVAFHFCSQIFAMLAIGANADLYLLFNTYNYINPPSLPPNVLIGRKECESIDIIMDEERFTIRSNRVQDSNFCAGSPETTISTLLYDHYTYERTVPAISALLKDRFWQRAEIVAISVIIGARVRDTHMDEILWCSVLDGLPKFTRTLSFKFTNRSFADHDSGLVEALADRDGKVKFPELEQLTVCYAEFSPEFVTERQRLLFEHMEERSKHAVRACKVSVLEQQVNYADFTLYTAAETEHIFVPISSDG